MKLTDAKLRTLSEPGKYFDGAGLYLELTAAGGRYWRLKYRMAGKEKRLALGVYPAVSLKEARDLANQARQTLQAGSDPAELRKAAKAKAAHEAVNTFRVVANEWMEHQSARWEPKTLEHIRSSLQANVLSTLGNRALSSITALDVMNAVKAVEARGAGEQAGRVLQRVKAIFRWAVIHGRLESNPMLDLVPSEILKPREVKHRAALDARELPAFLAKLDAYDGDPHTVYALRLLMLTATRPGEVRGARWDEVDMEAAMWVIPAERMKMRQEHRIPLSSQALKLLQSMQALSGTRELVFPSPFYPSKPLSENTFNSAMARMGYKNLATAHGFRALFSTVANEAGWRPDAIERQLAHVERNQVRAAYHRSTYMDERTKLLQWWADYLEVGKSGKVVHLHKRTA